MKTAEAPYASESKGLEAYARLLDSSIRLPGGFRIGLDGLIGLIPGVGDILAGLLSGVIVVQAHRQGASYAILSRMLLNIAAEVTIGAIPIVGDIFDFMFRANERNVRLLQSFNTQPKKVRRRSAVIVGLGVAGFLAFLSCIGILVWTLSAALFQLLAA